MEQTSTKQAEDIGELRGKTSSIENALIRIESKVDSSNKEHAKFHAHMSSKFDGFTAQHYQNIERWRKEDREFAQREINILRKDVIDPIIVDVNKIKDSSSVEKKEKKQFIRELLKQLFTGLIGFITAWFTLSSKTK